ncbi:MAG: hypothetical protein KKB66_11335 [Alphaproteobacteria bacterium]|nr:hypothetical protein [Alphaproteobacteria bacterium]MBU0804993.1 hypothetical protein [Alphaproteobacteria bacterium]MBU0870492.1 hypothetical protein [Alphaproteobacteria bacterium]MBU1401833.1 hypothetical protein [Alphaproteobacteria bacterium]MBU1591750.1 hypothetical protein [Alphaproteobacteria bacterium]
MLCHFAHQFPPFVESFLERGRSLRRRFREETVTDLMMGSLITAGSGRVIVEFPDEPATGADMEWNFVNPADNTFFRILLQAKQAYGEGMKWRRHAYRELLHTSGTGTKLQAETLCDTARVRGSATYPLYILYHPAHTCALARKDGVTDVAGVNLVDGYVIERLVKAAKNRALRTSNKSLRVIAPHIFPLSDIFCPPTILPAGPVAFAPGSFPGPFYALSAGGRRVIGIAIPPTPSDVRNRLAGRRGAQNVKDAPAVTEIASEIPDDVQAILGRARGSGRDDAPEEIRRWRITFVSASPRDGSEG